MASVAGFGPHPELLEFLGPWQNGRPRPLTRPNDRAPEDVSQEKAEVDTRRRSENSLDRSNHQSHPLDTRKVNHD
jgi:hypothetical protein